MENKKVCRGCHEEKLFEDFPVQLRVKRDGRGPRCRRCVSAQHRAYAQTSTGTAAQARYDRSEKGRARAARKRLKPEYKKRLRAYTARMRKEKGSKVHGRFLVGKAVARAVKSGRLERPESCSLCASSGPVHAHHDDYTERFEVRWLCARCHRAWHRENKAVYS